MNAIHRIATALSRRAGYELTPLNASDGNTLREMGEALTLIREAGFAPDLILDVGVANGTRGLYGVWPDAHYILLEPLQKYESALRKICASCRSAEYRIAWVSDHRGLLEIASDPGKPYTIRIASEAPPHWRFATIPLLMIDDLTAERTVRHAVVKIDVDGPEMAVLRGAERTFAELDCVIVIEAALLDEEYSRFGQIIEFLSSRGYDCFDIVDPMRRPRDGVLWQVDLVFVKRKSGLRASRSYAPV